VTPHHQLDAQEIAMVLLRRVNRTTLIAIGIAIAALAGLAHAVIEVVTARIHYCVCPLGPAMPFIKDGRALALAVADSQRSPLLPDVPAMPEAIPGFQRDGSFVLLAPAGTPRPILNLIGKDVARVLALPEVNERLQSMGFVPAPTTPEEVERIVRNDIATFAKVGRLVGLIASEETKAATARGR
jgi:tripartite-type tricarboxylate transporter receptor subunit TctC